MERAIFSERETYWWEEKRVSWGGERFLTFQKDGISYCMDLPACWRTQTKICTQCTLYTVQVAGLGIGIETYPVSSHHKLYGRAGCTPFSLRSVFVNAGSRNGWYRNEKECRCRNQSGTEIRGPSPVCSGTGLRCRMPECRCRRHQTWCRCPAVPAQLGRMPYRVSHLALASTRPLKVQGVYWHCHALRNSNHAPPPLAQHICFAPQKSCFMSFT
jgi:hypothetical protein